jgi:hypothetical protein
MAILLNDNLDVAANKPTDTRYGPYATVLVALNAIPVFKRYVGLTVAVGTTSIAEYWFRNGTADTDLIEKQTTTPAGTSVSQLPTPIMRLANFEGVAGSPYPGVDLINVLTGEALFPGGLKFMSTPQVVVQDISLDTFSNYDVFLECAIVRKSKRAKLKSYVVPSPWSGSIVNNVWTPSWDKPWPINNISRAGAHYISVYTSPTTLPIPTIVKVNRPNHFPVNANGQIVDLLPFLNGRFTLTEINYRTVGSMQTTITGGLELPTPVGLDKRNTLSPRYPYASKFAPLRIAARYLLWNSTTEEFIVGPFSRTAKIWTFPFPFNTDHFLSSVYGEPVATLNEGASNSSYAVQYIQRTWIE